MQSSGSSTAEADAVPGQKRWAAVLFADLQNFTALSERAGPEQTYELISAIVKAAWQVIERYEGRPVDYAGDSILAAFGAPVAVENASLNACRAAQALQAEMAGRAEEFRTRFGVEPRFRIGIAGGVVIVGALGMDTKMDLNLIGDTVNLAARIQSIAKGGETLCARSIFDEVEGFARMESIGTHQLKGFADPRELFRLTAAPDEISEFQGRYDRGSNVFAGREAELARLMDWIAAPPDRAGVIEVSGPAGIGKSRLLHEAFSALPPGGPRVLTAQCNSNIANKSLAPVAALIRQAFGWPADAPHDRLLADMAGFLGRDADGLGQMVDFLHRPDSWSRTANFDAAVRTRALMARAMARLCADPANLVVFEDIHWIDPVSEELLRLLIRAPQGPAKLLFSRRREYHLDGIDGAGVTAIALEPLGPAIVGRIISDLLGVTDIPDTLRDFVVATTEGNALFVEETIRYLTHSGQIAVEGGTVAFTPRAGEQTTAGNLQHLILSRFDALAKPVQAHLLIAATKGRGFSETFLARCVPDAAGLAPSLHRAAAAGLIEPDTVHGPGHWRFSHALIARAIGQSVLRQQRAALHATVAAGLEHDSATAADSVEELAYHHDRAGQARQAVPYLRQAAENALAIYSIEQADGYLERAFTLIGDDPGLVTDADFASLLVLWARTLNIYGDFRKLNQIIATHLPRVSAQGPSAALAMCLTFRAISRTHAGDRPLAISLVEQALEVATATGDAASVAWAKVAQMRIYTEARHAALAEVERLYAEIRSEVSGFRDPVLTQMAIYAMASAYREWGWLGRSNALIDEMTDYGRTHSDTRALGMAAWARCLNKWFAEDFDGMAQATAEALEYNIPDTGDWRVGAIGQLAVDMMQNRGDHQPEEFLTYRDNALRSEDMVLYLACGFQFCLQSLRHGRVRIAWTELLAMEGEVARLGTSEQRYQTSLLKARMLLALAGLEKSTAPRPKMALGDIVMALRLRLTAARRAKRELQRLLADYPSDTGMIAAHIQYGLGLIARSQRQKDAALRHFRLSHRLFVDEGLDARAAQSLAYAQALEPGN